MSRGNGATLVAYLHPNTVSHAFSDSLMRLVSYDMSAGSGTVIASGGPLMMRCGSGGLVEARNSVMKTFLDSPAEWLFMIDADMGFLPDTVDRLIDAADPVERPVVGGLCFAVREVVPDGYQGFKVRPLPTLYRWAQKPDGEFGFTTRRAYPDNTVVQVAGTGAACLLVHRTAAEKVKAEHGEIWFDQVRYTKSGQPVGEDLSFCYRLGTVGVPIFVHTGVKTTHHKAMWFGEEEYRLFERGFREVAEANRVSVLLPSRGRPDSLRASIDSLRDRATYPELLDILVMADPDDTATFELARELGVEARVAPERYGYGALHRYYNDLADAADGEWLLLWNDDATMTTDRWDEVLAAVPDDVLIADLQSQHSPRLVCFPAVRRRAVEAVGGFSPHTPHCDTYWQQVGRQTGTLAPVPIRVHHDRDDITGGHQDQTRAEGKAAYRTDEFFSSAVQRAIKLDAATIRGLR